MTFRFPSVVFLGFLLAACFVSPKASEGPVTFEKIELDGEFPAMTDFRFIPDSLDFLALSRSGKVSYYAFKGDKTTLLADFQIPSVHVAADCGAASLQLDPDFSVNQFFYVSYCTDVQTSTVSRFVFSADYFAQSVNSIAEIITVSDPLSTRSIHGAGAINFDRSKAMLVSFGEKGRADSAQALDNQLGKILRILPNRDPSGKGYDIPMDNPLFGGDVADDTVFAYGLRNPWRASFDASGRYWIADVGSTKFEEINIVTKRVPNFGWPKAEGDLCISICDGLTPPLLAYDHTSQTDRDKEDPLADRSTKFRVAWVGAEYIPKKVDRYGGLLSGYMLYGEWYVGWVRLAKASPKGTLIDDRHLANLPFAVAWNQGVDGYMYAATMFGNVSVDDDGNPKFASQKEMNGVLWRMVLSEESERNAL